MIQRIIEPIEQETLVQLPRADAFSYLTSRFGDWWPREYTFSKGMLDRICLGKDVDEWCFEQGPHGFHCDWGRILEWDAPRLLAFNWQIGPKSILQPDPNLCSEVRVEFADSTPDSSRVALKHTHFERHAADGADYRAEMASEYGWPLLLKMFTEAANG